MNIENKTNTNADEIIDDASKAEHMAYVEAPYRGELSKDGIIYRNTRREKRDIERGVSAAETAGYDYDTTMDAEKATSEGRDPRVEDLSKAAIMAYTAKPNMDKALKLEAMAAKTKDVSDGFRATLNGGPVTAGLIDMVATDPITIAAYVNRDRADTKMQKAGDAFDRSH